MASNCNKKDANDVHCELCQGFTPSGDEDAGCHVAKNVGLLQSRCKLVDLRRMSIGDIERDENIGILGASAGSERHRR